MVQPDLLRAGVRASTTGNASELVCSKCVLRVAKRKVTELDGIGDVRDGPANYYGIFDIHGLVWEWVDDFNAFLVTGDNREQGGADKLQFCGAGAITMEQKENYAVLMRVAMLSSLEARYTTRNMGFRCARNDTINQ